MTRTCFTKDHVHVYNFKGGRRRQGGEVIHLHGNGDRMNGIEIALLETPPLQRYAIHTTRGRGPYTAKEYIVCDESGLVEKDPSLQDSESER